ncbi:MAG: class I SAM-dependent methyltransferase [Chitinophagales bacterium]|nr:class I SAM-dependent methyltransferase [Chitinophagales bacterium]
MAAIQLIHQKSEVPKEFNRVSKSYDFATKMSQGYQDDLIASAKRMNLTGNEKLLDLCCGTGKSTLACLNELPSGTIVGVDNSEGMLREANKKFSNEIQTGKISFVLRDAMQLDFADNSFDAVFMAYGLRNMPDYDKAIKGIHRILKPGGKLCIHDYSLNENIFAKIYWAVLGYGFILPFCTLMSGSANIYLYLIKSVLSFLSPKQITNLLEQNGFTQVVAEPHNSWRKPILHSVIGIKKG